MLVLAVVIGVTATLLAVRRAGLTIPRFAAVQAVLVFGALIGAKLYSLLERGGVPESFGAAGGGGFRYPGGIVGLLAVVPLARWLLRREGRFLGLLDLIAPGICFAMATVRVGCLLAGCCFGVASHLPWAIRYPAETRAWAEHVRLGLISVDELWSLPVHPLPVYFGLVSLLVGVEFWRLEKQKRFEGEVFFTFLVFHELGKGLLEFVRAPELGQTFGHLKIASFALAGCGLLALWRARRLQSARNASVGVVEV